MIRKIEVHQALPLRQAVLWPDHPVTYSKVPGDDTALHFGKFQSDQIVAVGSLFTQSNCANWQRYRPTKAAALGRIGVLHDPARSPVWI